MENIIKMLKTHEGLRLKPYRDTVGKLTIGVGRNLDDIGINEEEALHLLNNDVNRTINELRTNLSFWNKLSIIRKEALIDMCFNIGLTSFMGFKRMLVALENEDYKESARQMLDSKWARQVGRRSGDLSYMMEYNRGMSDV